MTASASKGDALIGCVLDGRYQILERIGEGGMGIVYKARHISSDRSVAVKMLSPQMADDPTWIQRFNTEAKACSQLRHPNTIRILDFGQTDQEQVFMVMEFLSGQSLRRLLESEGTIGHRRVVKILVQCCASLAEAHAEKIIHRDIKPDNVFLLHRAGNRDFVKLLDFSVAKLDNPAVRTPAGVLFGTPQYMSPEQGRSASLDGRSDVYALGILAYEMLAGRVPFDDESPARVLNMHWQAPVPPLPAIVPPALQGFVLRCLEKDPARRFQSASEMMQQGRRILANLGRAKSAALASEAPLPAAPERDRLRADTAQTPAAPPRAAPDEATPPTAYAARRRPERALADRTRQQGRAVLLAGKKGMVSLPRSDKRVASAADRTQRTSYPMSRQRDAGILFWVLCLAAGVAVGILAYLVVITLGS